jgi:hypothetical protein
MQAKLPPQKNELPRSKLRSIETLKLQLFRPKGWGIEPLKIKTAY